MSKTLDEFRASLTETEEETKKKIYRELCEIADETLKEYEMYSIDTFIQLKGERTRIIIPTLGGAYDESRVREQRKKFEFTASRDRYRTAAIPLKDMPIEDMRRMLRNNRARLKRLKKHVVELTKRYSGDYAEAVFEHNTIARKILFKKIAIKKVKEFRSMFPLHPKNLTIACDRRLSLDGIPYHIHLDISSKGSQVKINRMPDYEPFSCAEALTFLYHLDRIKVEMEDIRNVFVKEAK